MLLEMLLVLRTMLQIVSMMMMTVEAIHMLSAIIAAVAIAALVHCKS